MSKLCLLARQNVNIMHERIRIKGNMRGDEVCMRDIK